MTPTLTFFAGLLLLILFGWYFATDHGPRKRLIATLLMFALAVPKKFFASAGMALILLIIG